MSARAPLAAAADCGPGGWGPPPATEEVDGEDLAAARSSQRKNMTIAICTMLLSVPALIGSWCWPIFVGVLIGLLSGQSFNTAATNASAHEHTISFFHGFQVAVTMTAMTSIVQYGYWTVISKRQGPQWTHWKKFQPVYILLVACILVNVQPMMILVIGSWSSGPFCTVAANALKWPCTNAFWTMSATNTFFPNRASGWLIQIFCTYVGYVLLITGVFQATDMVAKFKRTWRAARGQP